MGTTPSKLLSFEEAQSMLGPDLLARYQECFRRLCEGPHGLSAMRYPTWQQEVLSEYPMFPAELGKRAFLSATLGGQDLHLEDFVCACAILMRGNLELRLQFTFLAITAAALGSGSVSSGGLQSRKASFADLECVRMYAKYGTSSISAHESDANAAAVAEVFAWLGIQKNGTLDYATFREWAAAPLRPHRSADASTESYAATAAWAAKDRGGLSPEHVGPDDQSRAVAPQSTVPPLADAKFPPQGTPGAPSFPGQPQHEVTSESHRLRRSPLLGWVDHLIECLLPNPVLGGLRQLSLEDEGSALDAANEAGLPAMQLHGIKHRIQQARRKSATGMLDPATVAAIVGQFGAEKKQCICPTSGQKRSSLASSPLSQKLASSRGAQPAGSLPAQLIRLVVSACDPAGGTAASEKSLLSLLALCMGDSMQVHVEATLRIVQGTTAGSRPPEEVSWTRLQEFIFATWMLRECRRSGAVDLPMGWCFPVRVSEAESKWPREKSAVLKHVCDLVEESPGKAWKASSVHSLCRKWPQALDVAIAVGTAVCVDAGVIPATTQQQRTCLEACFKRFSEYSCGQPGDEWFAVNPAWWKSWAAYVDFSMGASGQDESSDGDAAQSAMMQRQASSAVIVEAPGPIENAGLLRVPKSVLMQHGLEAGKDVVMLPRRAWSALSSWYGADTTLGRGVVPKLVVPSDAVATSSTASAPQRGAADPISSELEFHPPFVCVRIVGKDGQAIPGGHFVRASKLASSADLMALADPVSSARSVTSGGLNRASLDARLWWRTEVDQSSPCAALVDQAQVSTAGGKWRPMKQLRVSAGEHPSPVYMHQLQVPDVFEVLLERKNLEGGWPLGGWDDEKAGSSSGVPGTSGPKPASHDPGAAPQPVAVPGSSKWQPLQVGDGRVGLYNQGNTCYANAAVQCLSHIRLLRDYFLSGEYAWDLNLEAPFGQGGRMSVAFASLCAEIWARSSTSITPRQLRAVLTRVRADFGTTRQQDAMELLDAMMSTLAEELNRNQKKPYIEQPDSNGRPDDVVANEWWCNHLQREKSVLTSLFTGQFRSTLRCCRCGNERCTYEVFTALSLPLPEPSKRPIRIQVFWQGALAQAQPSSGAGADESDGSVPNLRWWESSGGMLHGATPVEVSVNVPLHGTFGDLKSAIANGNYVPVATKSGAGDEIGSKVQLPRLSLDEMVITPAVFQSVVSTRAISDSEPLSRHPEGRTLACWQVQSKQDVSAAQSSGLGELKVHVERNARVLATLQVSQGVAQQIECIVRARHADGTFELLTAQTRRVVKGVASRFVDVVPQRPTQVWLQFRRMEPIRRWFLNESAYTPCDLPLSTRIPRERLSAADLYRYVWFATSRYVRRSRREEPPNACLHAQVMVQTVEQHWVPKEQSEEASAPDYGSDHESGSPAHGQLGSVPPSGQQTSSSDTSERPDGWVLLRSETVSVDWDEAIGTDSMTPVDIVNTWGFCIRRETGFSELGRKLAWHEHRSECEVLHPWHGKTLGRWSMKLNVPQYIVKDCRISEGAAEDPGSAPVAEGTERVSASGLVEVSRPRKVLREVRDAELRSQICAAIAMPDTVESSEPARALNATGGCFILDNEVLTVDWSPLLRNRALDAAAAQRMDVHPTVQRHIRERDQPLSIARCFDSFSRPEQLDDEQFCPRCSRVHDNVELRRHTKRLEVWRVPPVLVIQLKRFKHSQFGNRKLENLVTFQLDGLHLDPFMPRDQLEAPPPQLEEWRRLGGRMAGVQPARSGASVSSDKPHVASTDGIDVEEPEVPTLLRRSDCLYDLQGIVNHFGVMGGGHYVAYVRGDDGQWAAHNDSKVHTMPPDEVQTRHGYLLFYVRRDVKDARIQDLFPRRIDRDEPVDVDSIVVEESAGLFSVLPSCAIG